MSNLHNNRIPKHTVDSVYAGRFGIEIEEHRIQVGSKTLSRQPHPRTLGDRRTQPYFQTDFSESQEEVVTAPELSTALARTHLHELQVMLSEELADDEIIWPLSMPPLLTDDDINFLNTHFERPWYQDYRDRLLARYGSFQHIMAGIHVNFSPSEDVIDWYAQQHAITSPVVAKNQLFFQIAQQVAGYRWLLTYLFGAAPVSENPADALPENRHEIQPVRSWRSSDFGFVNRPEILVDYTDFNTHIQQIKQYIANGEFYDKSEFYGPVRLKASGDLDNLVQNGAEYLEFRMFDIDPFSQDGISQTALSFLHLLIIDAILNPTDWQKHKLDGARAINHVVSLQHPNEPLPTSAATYAEELLTRLADIVQSAPVSQQADFQEALDFAHSAVQDPTLTIGAHLSNYIVDDSLITFGLKRGLEILASRHHNTLADDFPTIPENLRKAYIQAHKNGLNVLTVTKDGSLQIKYDGKIQNINNEQDLAQYLTK